MYALQQLDDIYGETLSKLRVLLIHAGLKSLLVAKRSLYAVLLYQNHLLIKYLLIDVQNCDDICHFKSFRTSMDLCSCHDLRIYIIMETLEGLTFHQAELHCHPLSVLL